LFPIGKTLLARRVPRRTALPTVERLALFGLLRYFEQAPEKLHVQVKASG
jgi:hypothetical protein